MCQISAVLEQDGRQEKIMDNVTTLEVTPQGIVLSTLFEEPRLVPSCRIEKIDFLGGNVTLVADRGGNEMTEVEKVRVLLPHLIEHNHGHGGEYAKWAQVLRESGKQEAAALMEKAIESLQKADEALVAALEKIGGPLEDKKQSHQHD